MAREISNWRLVQASACVDVDCVCDVFCRLCVIDSRMNCFVLTSRCEKQTAVRSKGETPKERSESLVEVYGCVPDPGRVADTVQAWRIWHHCGQRH